MPYNFKKEYVEKLHNRTLIKEYSQLKKEHPSGKYTKMYASVIKDRQKEGILSSRAGKTRQVSRGFQLLSLSGRRI